MRQVLQEKYPIQGSSLVDYFIYDYKEHQLTVKYKRGKWKNQEKVYSNITTEEYYHIIQSQSKGKALLKLLKEKKENSNIVNKILAFLKQY